MLSKKIKTFQRGAVVVSASIVSMLLLNPLHAYADETLTAEELRGRKIYRNGDDGTNHEIVASLGLSSDTVSATTFACANCHGLEGEGKQEGGLTVPTISAEHLFKSDSSNSLQEYFYTSKTLLRAITRGIGAQNKPLSSAMPRYALSHDQAQALVAYLRRLGSANDVDAGITPTEVQLGTLLPLTGPASATGRNLQATLEACVTELNRQGALYGRKLTLTTIDSGSTPQEALAATQRLIAETQPFALIAGYLPEFTEDIHELLIQEQLPLIAPLTFTPKATVVPAARIFYFLPSYSDQSIALIDYWYEHHESQSKLAIVYSDRLSNTNVVRQVRAHLQSRQLQALTEVAMPQTIQAIKAKPDAIFFLGNSQELLELNELLVKSTQQPMLLGLLAMLGSEVINMPDLVMTNRMLATPFALNDPGLELFTEMLDSYSVSLQNQGLQRIACSAVNFVGEGLKRAGKHLSRANFTQSLEEIRSFTVEIMPPQNFRPNVQQGIKGAYILTVDKKASSAFLSEWVSSTSD